jgi:hypothetical protein
MAPEWTPWSLRDGAPASMVFDTSGDGGVRMIGRGADTDELASCLATDPAFAGDPDGRCALCVRMFAHSVFGTDTAAALRAGCCAAAGVSQARPVHWP